MRCMSASAICTHKPRNGTPMRDYGAVTPQGQAKRHCRTGKVGYAY
jgi:hypothetical protein